MKIIKKTITFIQEVRQEMGKVTWSTKEELIGATYVVIGITAIMALYIGFVDLLLSRILRVVFS